MGKRKKSIPLPKKWPLRVKSALLHVISLAQYATAYTQGWAANRVNARVRLKAACDELEERVSRLEERIRITDARTTLAAGFTVRGATDPGCGTAW